MANLEHLDILKQGVETWNRWREEYPEIQPDISKAKLIKADLHKINFSKANLYRIDLSQAFLTEANFEGANLEEAHFEHSILVLTNFVAANLHKANLMGAILILANLESANLSGAHFTMANLESANLSRTNLRNAQILWAILVRTNLEYADLTGASIYGVSAWDLKLTGAIQSNLVITHDSPTITVDDIEMAQFIHLLLSNQNIRQVIDTITSQVVLILGRFRGERKTVAQLLKQELRTQNYSPVVFDFEELDNPDFRETVKTLANMARFVLIDLTDLDNVLKEIVKVIPHCRVPIQPLLLLDTHQYQYNQFLDLRRKHHWLLPLYHYQNSSDLLASFQEKIIQPVEEKSEDLKQRKLIQLFFCYALEDTKPAAKLKKHLSLLERSGQIAIWDAYKLAPGEERGREIERHLSNAHIILLLISPDFLVSNECITIQERAMERYERGNATIIPLILRPCGWQSTPLSKLQVLPRDQKPLARHNLDGILFEVTDMIADVIKDLS